MLETHNISLQTGTRNILSGISTALPEGQITAIIGPNGAGKSSLLKVLTGEWEPTAGMVILDGQPLASYSPKILAQRRACLPQESHLDFAFTVMEVVLLGRSPLMPRGEQQIDHELALQALMEVDMEDCRDRLYTQLSGGEKKRVQLARVLAQLLPVGEDPTKYLFLDEPMNALDLEHQVKCMTIIQRLASRGTTICLVVHDLNQAMQLADQVILLDHGKLVMSGAPEELIASPHLEKVMGTRLEQLAFAGGKLPWLIPVRKAP